jgi:hypothetical protein
VVQPTALATMSDAQSPIFKYKKVPFKRKQAVDTDSDSDDSHCKHVQASSAKRSTRTLREQLENDDDSDVEVAHFQPAAKTKSSVERMLDSDDEGEAQSHPIKPVASYLYGKNNKENSETIQMLLKSREAQRKLILAQNYHAEDVFIPIMSAPVELPASRPAPAAPAPVSLGANITLKVRTTIIVNNQKSNQPLEDLMVVKEHEPLQRLLDRYRKQKGLSHGTKIIFCFEGVMDMTKTPKFYELEDEDLIDVSYQTLAIMARKPGKSVETAAAPTKKVDLGAALFVNLRTVQGSKEISNEVYKTYEKETFQMLGEKFRKKNKIAASKTIQFFFEDVLKMNQTPADVDMESDETIDVKIK